MTAIAATFSDFRIVKGRKVAQLVLEVPLEKADDALKLLGGVPRPDAERWVGVAPLKAEPKAQEPKERRPFHTLARSAQAALLAEDERFRKWIGAKDADEATRHIKGSLAIASRTELNSNPEKGGLFDDMVRQFEDWKFNESLPDRRG